MSQRPFQPLFPEHEDERSILKDGRPLRIPVIAMETGRTNDRVTLEERRQESAGPAVRFWEDIAAPRSAILRAIGPVTRGVVLLTRRLLPWR